MRHERSATRTFLFFLVLTVFVFILYYFLPLDMVISLVLIYVGLFLFAITALLFLFFVFELISHGIPPILKRERKEDTDKEEKKRVSGDRHGAASYSQSTSPKKESFFSRLNPFGGKDKCNDCGTELEYREEYHSYYCPKCRTYKGERR